MHREVARRAAAHLLPELLELLVGPFRYGALPMQRLYGGREKRSSPNLFRVEGLGVRV